MQKLTKERGREENPRQDGKRRRGQRSGGGGAKRRDWVSEESGGTPCPPAKEKGIAPLARL